ncbi:protein kinase [Planomonospora sp. ID67723]|uniref:WD40 repeat domain-containing serine/threonine protein kinase n=1 Tax=Planomonospora sp. ID67723 TaxID=2738134 RepID=UPI0018C403A9|nr:serine/threonine-protein kinase [Planomonospora sp. ID67723]MBG0831514.1 protein kinase [Planomonospora sp. ID67723]
MPDPGPLAARDPEQVGPYRLSAVLGEGGQGTVYLAQAPAGRKVAVKVLHARMAADPASRERFLREADLARQVAVFCTARILDMGITDDDRPYLVSEYIPGPSLHALVVEDGPRAEGGLERLAITTLTALEAIHRAGIVHRDFKPSNVIMGPEGPVVIDFGIARLLEQTTTRSGPVGTPAYLAPEQLHGHSAGTASDVFSWAAAMVYAATGHLAFPGPSTAAVIGAIVTREPDLSGVPDRHNPLLTACLAKDPAERPAVPDLLAAFTHDRALPGRGRNRPAADTAQPTESRSSPDVLVAASPRDHAGKGDPPAGQARPQAAPTDAPPAPPAVLSFMPRPVMPEADPGTGEAGRAPRQHPAPTADASPHDVSRTSAHAITTTPARERSDHPPMPPSAPADPPSRRTTRRLRLAALAAAVSVAIAILVWLRNPLTGENRTPSSAPTTSPASTAVVGPFGAPIGEPFTGHEGAVRAVAVAQLDGRPVVVSGGDDDSRNDDGAVWVWDLATGKPVGKPFTGHIDGVRAVAVAQLDGRPVVISGGRDDTVRVWDLATRKPVGKPFTGHKNAVWAVALTQLDGRPVVVSGSEDRTMRVWDLATRKPIGKPLAIDDGDAGAVYAVAVAQSDGRPVAISGNDLGTVRVWDLATGEAIRDPFAGHEDSVWAVAAAQLDGRPVVISGGDDYYADVQRDATVGVRDLATGKPIGKPFTGHKRGVRAVAAAQLGGRPVVVSGGDDDSHSDNDGAVRVWDLATGKPIGKPFTIDDEDAGAVYAVAVAQLDGRPVAVSGNDLGTVRVWSLAPPYPSPGP